MKLTLRLGLMTAMTLTVMTAAADIADTGKKMAEQPRFINSQFTYGHQPQLLIKGDDYDASSRNKFTILDKTFNEIKSFEAPEYATVSATYTVEDAIHGPKDVREAYRQDNLYWENISLEEFANNCRGNGFARQEEKDGEVFFYTYESWGYWWYEIFGMRYPSRYFRWVESEKAGYEVVVEYSFDAWGPTGEYGEPREVTESSTPSVSRIYPSSEECGDMETIYITQTLFNTDEAYEWIVPVYNTVDRSYTTEQERVSGQRIVMTGFKVMSETGSTVAEVSYPAGYYGADSYVGEFDMMIVDGHYYLMARVQNSDKSEEYYIVYEITGGDNAVRMVGAPIRVSVCPTAPRRGTPVEVALGETSGEGCKVTVVSASGRVVLSRNVEAGATGVTIDTDRMEQGVYVVNVTDRRGSRQATKIVIR